MHIKQETLGRFEINIIDVFMAQLKKMTNVEKSNQAINKLLKNKYNVRFIKF